MVEYRIGTYLFAKPLKIETRKRRGAAALAFERQVYAFLESSA